MGEVLGDRAILRAVELTLAAFVGVGPVSLVIGDVDHLKDVNDRYGHLAGDRVLVAIGDCLLSQSREDDFVGRYAGDKFVAILPDTPLAVARAWAELVRRAIHEVCVSGLPHPPATMSMGVGTHDGRETPIAFFDRVYDATFLAKEEGRDRVEGA